MIGSASIPVKASGVLGFELAGAELAGSELAGGELAGCELASPKTAASVKGWSYILSNLKTVVETGQALPPLM